MQTTASLEKASIYVLKRVLALSTKVDVTLVALVKNIVKKELI